MHVVKNVKSVCPTCSFHDILMKTVQEVLAKHGKCFIFDIHGNKSLENIIEFGYGLTIKQLKNIIKKFLPTI